MLPDFDQGWEKDSDFLVKAERIAAMVIKEIGRRDRTGGYLYIAEDDGTPILTVKVGEIKDLERAWKCFQFCQEKGLRLRENPHHVSSWQSRDPEKEKWGGGVRLGHKIITFSGLPEKGDEALVLLLAYMYDKNLLDKVVEIAWISKNEIFAAMLKDLNK